MLRIGTDCTGMDAPLFALRELGIKYIYKFGSEIDKYARKTIEANHMPEVLYDDMTAPRVLPKIDVYVAGFPCQPFSLAGKNKGSEDERCIFEFVYDAIFKTEPDYFILENVPRLTSNKYYDIIKSKLSNLTEYNICYNLYNSKDYGIPQNRNRLFIIGIKKSLKTYEIPKFIPCRPIESFITVSNAHDEFPQYIIDRMDTLKDTTIINANVIRCGSKINRKDLCNTLTKNGDVWCIKEHRRANIRELLSIQGFPSDFIQVVSDSQLKKQIGNSMNVCVLKAIFKELLF